MTDKSHRTYAVALALVVFFLTWATVTASPWAASEPDPRIAALAQREARLRAEARVVKQIVDRRIVTYRIALKQRKVEIARTKARYRREAQQAAQQEAQIAADAAAATSAAASVRVVDLPPLTITRSS